MDDIQSKIDILKEQLEYIEHEPVSGINHGIVNKYPNNSTIKIIRDSDNKIINYTISNYKIYKEDGNEL